MKKVNKFVLNEIDDTGFLQKNEMKEILGGYNLNDYEGVCFYCYVVFTYPSHTELGEVRQICNVSDQEAQIMLRSSISLPPGAISFSTRCQSGDGEIQY